MKTVFSTEKFDVSLRFAKWQEAICEHYLTVDVSSQRPEEYYGFIKESVLGPLVITDLYLSNQEIVRNQQHIAYQDKTCFFIMFPSKGSFLIEQAGEKQLSTPGTAVLFDSAKPYRFCCHDYCQSMCIEVPTSILAAKYPINKISKPLALDFTEGLGWALLVFCNSIAVGSESYGSDMATKVADEITDLLVLYIDAESKRKPSSKSLSTEFRLQAIKSFIESHLNDPELSPISIAKNNGISLRYLHHLFKRSNSTVSEWVREKRLEKSRQKLTSKKFKDESITDIALSLGFNSSSHFTKTFKQKFGLTPRSTRKMLAG